MPQWLVANIKIDILNHAIITRNMREKTTTKKTKQSDVALRVEHVSKSFRLPTEKSNGIKQLAINTLKGVKGYDEQQVLKDISFNVEKGDFFGIVGRNGSGKSTLLKIISQIYEPDSGSVSVNGKLVPFIELGVGFNPELTGRENVYLNGALLGFSHEEVNAMYEDIVEFAELEKFMDQKLKNYSSGMQVRLAFSIAIKADADILVLDEVLAVGDEAFQRKCFGYFAELKRNKKTVILVTHSMDYVLKFCNKAALIDKGHDLEVGRPVDIAHIYRSINIQSKDKNKNKTGDSSVIGTQVDNINIESSHTINNKELTFVINVISKVEIKDVVITVVIHKDSGEPVYRWVTDENVENKIDIIPGAPFDLSLVVQNIFPSGEFRVQIGVKKSDRTEDYLISENAIVFELVSRTFMTDGMYWSPDVRYTITGRDVVNEKK